MEKKDEEYKQVDKYIVTSTIIGQGAFGKVLKGFFKDDPTKAVAVKVIPFDKVNTDKKFIQLLKREIEILQKIKADNIVQLYYATRTPNNLYMFLEFCSDGDLKQLIISRGGKLNESEAVMYFRQICKGFKVLYDHKIIHRDIKPANILLHEGKALISDFGFARCLDQFDMDKQWKMTFLGTPLYMSPQILEETVFSSKCDIWSLGMVFYEMLYGKTPFTGKTPGQLLTNIQQQQLYFPDTFKITDLVKDMLRKMMVVSDEERISWQDLFNHPLIHYDYDQIVKEIEQISIQDGDNLLKSVQVNEFYMRKNKIMGPDKIGAKPKELIQSQGQENQSSQVKSHTNDQLQQQQKIDIIQVQKQQEQQQQVRKTIIMIDSYLTYNRNVNIFVNLTTNQIFKLFKEDILKINDVLFYRIMFILQKYQLIGYQAILNILDKKTLIEKTRPEDFQMYQQSKEYYETRQIIENDYGFIKPYFKEVYERTVNFLKAKQTNEVQVKEFLQALNDDLTQGNPVFNKIYIDTLNEFLKVIQPQITQKNIKKRKELLQSISYIIISRNPYQQFVWKLQDNADFHEFYDKYDKMNEDELEQEVLKQYKTL